MIMVFVYTFNDYFDSLVVINVDQTIPNEQSVFPAVSICIRKSNNKRSNTERIKKFVEKYYAEHNIKEPK